MEHTRLQHPRKPQPPSPLWVCPTPRCLKAPSTLTVESDLRSLLETESISYCQALSQLGQEWPPSTKLSSSPLFRAPLGSGCLTPKLHFPALLPFLTPLHPANSHVHLGRSQSISLKPATASRFSSEQPSAAPHCLPNKAQAPTQPRLPLSPGPSSWSEPLGAAVVP